MQDRLWITEPRRATCLAQVNEVRDDWFAVDRALFAPRSRAFRHPQNPDEGTVWIEGEKRRLGGVKEEAGTVWYSLRGTTPPQDKQLQCELDQEVRDLAARAHTAMHLLLGALPDEPPMVTDPEVKGGGHFRLEFAWPVAPEALAAALKVAQQAVAADTPVATRYEPREVAKRVATPQSFQPPDPVPGGDVLPMVTTGPVVMPCDGCHVERTVQVGRIVVAHAAPGREGFVVTGKVE